jgi:hypothetical protein
MKRILNGFSESEMSNQSSGCDKQRNHIMLSQHKEIIRDLLNQIDDKYPQERKEKAIAKYKKLWDFNTVFNEVPVAFHRGLLVDGLRHPLYHTPEERFETLKQKLEDIIKMADVDDDYIPVLTLDTGAYIIGNAYGAKYIKSSNMHMIEHIIHSENDARNFPDFNPDGENFLMNKVFDMMKFMSDMTDGRIKINIHTPQGVIETASTLWEANDFYINIALKPELVNKVMVKIYQGYRYYIAQQQKILGNSAQFNFAMSYNHRPSGTGIGVGEDIIVTLSPDNLRCFNKWYDKIYNDFGPILLHSCGNPSQHIEVINEIDAIHGVQLSQIRGEDYFHLLKEKCIIQSCNDWKDVDDLKDFCKGARETGKRFNLQIQSLPGFIDNVLEEKEQKQKQGRNFNIPLIKNALKIVKKITAEYNYN